MSLIKFQNYPSTETPLNAENLNHNFNELNKANTYSTEEQVVGTWIDGKKIYRKIINDIEITPGTGKEVVTGITNVDKAIKIEGLFYFDTTKQGITIPSYYTDATFISANFAFDSHNIFYDCAGFNGHGYIAFEYTKTTD